jgi:DNA polymerase-4
MHIDLNSCFATIEQQANPLLRGKPIAIAAYATDRGCILAPSIEAKRFGVKTGMRVKEGKQLCANLIVLPSDPPKYRFVNQALLKLFSQYTPHLSVRSIDEMLLNFEKLPITNQKTMPAIGQEIKQRIKREIGEWLTVSIGIATNPYLAKVAAGLHKPDGLDEITNGNIIAILSGLRLTDLPYIKEGNQARLNRSGIFTPLDFYHASAQTLKYAFASVTGDYWYLRLHGLPIDAVEWQRKSIGHSYALPKFTNDRKTLEQLLYKLVEKMGRRIRRNAFTVQGIYLACNFADGSYWHRGHKTPQKMYASHDLFKAAQGLLFQIVPLKPVRILAVSSFLIDQDLYAQLELFTDESKKRALTQALDAINDQWGEFSVMPASLLAVKTNIVDRIAFGKVHDMPRVVLKQEVTAQREPIYS